MTVAGGVGEDPCALTLLGRFDGDSVVPRSALHSGRRQSRCVLRTRPFWPGLSRALPLEPSWPAEVGPFRWRGYDVFCVAR
jgi:hypothetical protein